MYRLRLWRTAFRDVDGGRDWTVPVDPVTIDE
jgi:hypothetical protein